MEEKEEEEEEQEKIPDCYRVPWGWPSAAIRGTLALGA
jgi:hypothetical protein